MVFDPYLVIDLDDIPLSKKLVASGAYAIWSVSAHRGISPSRGVSGDTVLRMCLDRASFAGSADNCMSVITPGVSSLKKAPTSTLQGLVEDGDTPDPAPVRCGRLDGLAS